MKKKQRVTRIEVGCGLGTGENAFASGANAARQAVSGIKEHALAAVLIFASVRYDLENLLRGIHSAVGEVPVLGATTAGEIYDSPHRESVVIVALASPHLTVRVGVGQGVSLDWRQAVDEAIHAPGVRPFFSPQDNSLWQELTRQGKAAFALMFSPGNTRHADSRSYEILEELKRLSQGRLPIFGGSSADDWQMEENYVLWGQRAYSDSVLVAVVETHLRFGIGLAHGFRPGPQRATITRARGHEVLELDGKPGAEVYARMLDTSQEALKGKHLTLTTGKPAGTPDPYGQYSLNVASYFTPAAGVRFAQPVPQGTVLVIMRADEDDLLAAGQEALRKALLRGEIVEPAVALVCPCALRMRILGERTEEEIAGMKAMIPQVPLVGFYSFGEQGLADDGVNRHNNEVITVLVLGQELSYAAQVALENERLRAELWESERRFRGLVESMDDVVFTLDREQRHTGVFGRWIKKQGLTSDVFLGKTAHEILGAEAAGVHEMANERALAGEHVVYEWSIAGANGIEHYQTSLSPLQDAKGAITGLVGVGRDITRRKSAEEELQRAWERLHEFESIINRSPVFVFLWRMAEGWPVEFASNNVKQLGYTAQDFVSGRVSWPGITHPEDMPRLEQEVAEYLSQGIMEFSQEYRLLTRSGEVRWVTNWSKAIQDASGTVVRIQGIVLDITEQRRLEKQLEGLNRLKENLLGPGSLDEKFERITAGTVAIFDADFARIWIIQPGDLCDAGCFHASVTEGPHVCRYKDRCLRLVASSGRYTHIDGKVHRRVPFGCYKIGRIAAEKDPKFITNDVSNDLRVHDREWVRELGLVSFAGYRILSADGKPMGVLALFGQRAISPEEDVLLEGLADTTAQLIQTATERERAEERLHIQRDLGLALSAAPDLNRTLRLCVEAAIRASDMDCGGVYLVDEASGDLALVFHQGLPPDFVESASHYDAGSADARLVMAGEPRYISQQQLEAVGGDERRRAGLRSVAVIPVPYEERVIACLNIASYTRDDVPDLARTALETIAAQIGNAIARSKAEEALRQSRANLRTLFDSLEDFLFVLDMEGRILHVNPAVARRLGYPEQELSGESVLKVHPPERHAETAAIVADMIAGQTDVCPVPVMTRDGSLIPVETKVVQGLWDGRAVLFGISRDITERVQAERALAESEGRLRSVLTSMDDLVFVFDRQGRFIHYYAPLERLFIAPEEFLGKKHADIMPSDVDGLFVQAFQKTQAGESAEYEYQIRSDTKVGWYSAKLSPMFLNDEFVGSVAVVRNITERKLAEEEREKLIHELEQSLAKVQTLSGLLPICASCKKIRDDKGYWTQVEVYIHEHAKVEFSHGLCPDCQQELYPAAKYPFLYEADE